MKKPEFTASTTQSFSRLGLVSFVLATALAGGCHKNYNTDNPTMSGERPDLSSQANPLANPADNGAGSVEPLKSVVNAPQPENPSSLETVNPTTAQTPNPDEATASDAKAADTVPQQSGVIQSASQTTTLNPPTTAAKVNRQNGKPVETPVKAVISATIDNSPATTEPQVDEVISKQDCLDATHKSYGTFTVPKNNDCPPSARWKLNEKWQNKEAGR